MCGGKLGIRARKLCPVGASYSQRSREVAAAFVEGYEGFVRRKVASLGGGAAGLDDAIVAGRRQLESDFEEWRHLPATAQRASPLELFRNALRLPTEALLDAGHPTAVRDEGSTRSLPGDVFDLAPMSSKEIGERAWLAHVAWGLTRAEEVAGMVPASAAVAPSGAPPVAALVGTDLMDRSKLAAAAEQAGFELVVWRNPGAIARALAAAPPAVAFVDLTHPGANEAIERLVDAGVRTVAFGPHVDDIAMAGAGALGASEVLPRSRFFKRLPSLFPTVV